MAQNFRGSHAVTITPFTEDGSAIDIPAWKRFLDWQMKEGVPGIIILGTTGEFLTLTDDERTLFVDSTIKYVAGRMQVMVGTMNAYTPNAVRYSREAEELGADGLMIIPPYYYTPTEDEIFARWTLPDLNAQKPLEDVFFDLDQSDLNDTARASLAKDATWMKRWSTTIVTVTPCRAFPDNSATNWLAILPG